VPATFPPVYAWLAQNRPAAAVELPIGWNETEAYYVLADSVHRVPIMNGVSGFDPPLHEELRNTHGDALLARIAAQHVDIVVVHPAVADDARRWTDEGKLRELVRFADGDAVYALTPAPAGTASAPRG
jgi:hypothetical protein